MSEEIGSRAVLLDTRTLPGYSELLRDTNAPAGALRFKRPPPKSSFIRSTRRRDTNAEKAS